MTNRELLTALELARLLGLSIEAIWRYTREKRIPYIELASGQYRYLVEDVVSILNAGADGQVHEEPAEYVVGRKLTYEDYAKLPNEVGYTVQLIDGLIIREPGPTVLHQRVSRRIQSILMAYFSEVDPRGEVFYAPLDLQLDEHTVVQPDLLYFSGTKQVSEAPIDIVPDLVVEIVSPSTVSTDRIRKFHSYQKAGVPHYWIVDPGEGIMQCYQLLNDYYSKVASFDEGAFTHASFPGLALEIETLFAKNEMPKEDHV